MTRAEHIALLYREGKSQREIGRIVGISQPAVRKHLLKLGLITPAAVSREGGSDNLDQRQREEPPETSHEAHPPARCESPGPHNNRPERGSDNHPPPGQDQAITPSPDNHLDYPPATPTRLKVLFRTPRPRCLACGGTVKVNKRGFLLTEENQPLGSLCLRCLVNGPQAASEKMRAYASSLMGVADRVAKLDGATWTPMAIICSPPPLHPGGPRLPR